MRPYINRVQHLWWVIQTFSLPALFEDKRSNVQQHRKFSKLKTVSLIITIPHESRYRDKTLYRSEPREILSISTKPT